MRPPVPRRPVDRRAGASCAALAALCCLVAAPQARAAAEDINAEPAMSGFDAVAAASRQLVERVVDTEHAVVHALKQDARESWVAPSWSLSADAPIVRGRPVDYAMRASAAAAAATAANSAETAPRSTGTADLSFGARLRVLHGDADLHIPAVSWMADVQPATSGASSGSTVLRPSTHLSAEWSLPGDFSLGVMPGVAVDLDAYGRRTANGTLAVTVGKAWSPQWRTFIDMARDRLAAVQLGGVSTTLDAGVSFAATPATQLDFAVTHGLSPSAPPFQAGVGVSSSF